MSLCGSFGKGRLVPEKSKAKNELTLKEEKIDSHHKEGENQKERKKRKRTLPRRGLPLLRGRFSRDSQTNKVKKRRKRRLKPRPPTNFKQEIFTIPNMLTYLRILMIPLILVVLDRDSRWYSFLGAIIFAGASLTDLVDGYLARKLNQVTILGKFLDPLADKLVVSAVLIVMVPMGRVSSWIVIVLLAREIAVTGLRAIAASEGIVIAAAPLGKQKTAVQMLSIFALLIHYPFIINYFGLFSVQVNFHRVGILFLYVSLALSLISGFDYFWKFGIGINNKYKSDQVVPEK